MNHPLRRRRAAGRLVWLLLASACGLAAAPPVQADDTEIFVGGNSTTTIRPNILFIFDNSGSMNERIVTQAPYDPAYNYITGTTCRADRVYFSESTSIPSCDSSSTVNLSAIACKAALDAFGTSGFFIDRMARYDVSRDPGSRRWDSLTNSYRSHTVDCKADSGVHGIDAASTAKFAIDETSSRLSPTGYGSVASQVIAWDSEKTYRIYHPNYVAWNASGRGTSRTKIAIVREVATNLLNSITGVNVGLMYFSDNAQGGLVAVPVENLETNRATMISVLNGLVAETWTPLSETMWEAGLYWRGQTWRYGANSTRNDSFFPSVPGSRLSSPNTVYKTPIEYSCQKNYIVYLTDGEPTEDTDVNNLAPNLIGRSCDSDGSVSGSNGVCLDDLAEYYATKDLNSTIPGTQSVLTYTIGFATNQTLLQRTATRGGGKYYTANDTTELASAFQAIVTEILDINTTFSSPTVSVNAFNRTQNLNDIYVTVFRPSLKALWPGNLKKYQIDPVTGDIEDVLGRPAVNPDTGFFTDAAQSYWSPAVDGAQASQGGAASRLPLPANRKMYTYHAGSTTTDLTHSSNAWSTANPALTAAALGVGATSTVTVAQAVDWLRGADIFDADADANTTEARLAMGDPLHSRPATVIYGGTAAAPNANDGVVFTATNEGILQAVDVTSGSELWSFVPETTWQSVLRGLDSTSTSNKLSTLDGSIQTYRFDRNFNGVIEPADGDKVYLFFGQRRGGTNYFALDVTVKQSPRFLWRSGSAQLPGIGETWSTPQVTRVNVGGTVRDVVIFGGGYEADQDPVNGVTAYSTDTTGNGLYMLDATNGALVWRAGGSGSGANLVLAKMNNSIPADVRVVDFDGDGLADRMYAADMGGRVWRFDIFNGNSAGNLVTGGVFASLGNADETTRPVASTRRFYYAPDVALVRKRGQTPYLAVNIGSGYRASPLNTQVEDRFYALRDYAMFTRRTQAEYDAWTVITDAALTDVTSTATPTLASGIPGWKIRLTRGGEKILAEARTFGNVIFFPTFTPDTSGGTASCAPRQGTNRLFSINLFDGSPANNRSAGVTPTTADRELRLSQGGIAPEAVFLFPTPDAACTGSACRPAPQCLVGVEKCGIEFTNAPVKTYWRERQVTP
ncbi:MAG: pilus assembly protein [Gammaproteobacteria bacterium]